MVVINLNWPNVYYPAYLVGTTHHLRLRAVITKRNIP
jgi:hypothetical protein